MTDTAEKIAQKLDKPIVLVGMMGAGKTHYGSQLAKELGLTFFDSDKIVEEKAGQSVSDIFENFGEAKFREAEQNSILECLDNGALVLATGGGALMREATLNALKEKSIMIWLDTAFDVIWERVQKSSSRPLLQDENPQKKLHDLMEQRDPLYRQAHIHLNLDQQTAQKGIEPVIKALYAHLFEDMKNP